jgi:TIR domain
VDAIKVFLSHKYEAPCVNQYFFQLFSSTNLQFEVDKGKFSTNVTRLERMIRDADAFMAIYPFDDDGAQEASNAELMERSKYFRLELEIATRSGKPGLILLDRRFRGIIDVPTSMLREQFDVREVTGDGAKPSATRFIKKFSEFVDLVKASVQYGLSSGDAAGQSDAVGILLPAGSGFYGPDHMAMVSKAIAEAHYTPVPLRWPATITAGWLSQIRSFNWIMLDVGPDSMSTGIPGFAHGAFIPTMRLMRVAGEEAAKPAPMPDSSLYGGVEAGYWKDIARWWDAASLESELGKRLATLDAPTRRFNTLPDALAYFQEAAKRKERVFISYTGADEDETRELRLAFARKFQDVFDYRDGKSIQPGQPWIEEISKSLARSPIAVLLLSSAYIASGHCQHEMNDAVALRDAKQTRLFPVKLKKDDPPEMPGPLSSTQYVRLYDYESPDKMVDALIAALGQSPDSPITLPVSVSKSTA